MAAYWMAVAAHSGAALRSLLGRCDVAHPTLANRNSIRARRNPVLALPECDRLAMIPAGERAGLRAALAEIRRDASLLADDAWKSSPQMAAHWRCVSVYAGHLASAVGGVLNSRL
jgi:hypothetical protein